MSRLSKVLRGTLEVAIVDAAIIAACIGLAAVFGTFDRAAVGLLVLVAGGLFALVAGAAAGGVHYYGHSLGSQMPATNYERTMIAELEIQQQLSSEAVAEDARKRHRGSLPLVAIGVSLIVLAFFISGP